MKMDTSLGATDLSGDEPDSDTNTIDSLDSHFNEMSWDNSNMARPFGSVSSNEDELYLLGSTQPASTSRWQVPDAPVPTLPLQEQNPSQMSMFPSDYTTDMSEILTRASTSNIPVKTEESSPNESINVPPASTIPEVNLDALAPRLSQEARPPSRRPSDLAKLSTTGLPSSNLHLSIPQTPSRFGNFAGLSPAHTALMMGNMDLSAWLDEPVVPTPLYEPGACTGWNGLMSAIDVGKTPTVNSVRANERDSLKGPRPSSNLQFTTMASETMAQGKNQSDSDHSTPISPVLISSEDWWARDQAAQWRYHRYMLSTFPKKNFLRANDPKSSLGMSVISRFMAYCAFLCLAEPNAPQPPFLHRQLLVAQRDTLPETLAVTRCILASLTLRLPTSEAFAWGQAAQELEKQVNHAHEVVVTIFKHVNGPGSTQCIPSFDDMMKIMALCQTLWFYIVVGVFGDSFDQPEAQGFTLQHRIWDTSLLFKAIDALQSIMQLIAALMPELQRQSASAMMSESKRDPHSREFLWWGLGESLRRTVLASHVLLILLRYCLYDTQSPLAPYTEVATLGLPPFPATTYTNKLWTADDWQKVMDISLPSVAKVFEADSPNVWRSQWHNQQMWCALEPTLTMFYAHRPLNAEQSRTETQINIYNYLHQHDEFTNVCLSAIYGLTKDL